MENFFDLNQLCLVDKPNSVGENGHPCLTPMLDITSTHVLPFTLTFAWTMVYMAFKPCCK